MTLPQETGPDFSLRARARAFADAGRGLLGLFATQAHAWVHAAATLGVVLLGIWLELSVAKWCLLVGAIAAVWVTETLNTALEQLADALHPTRHEGVGRAKDTAAAAVLLAALGALIVGCLVLGPPLKERLSG